MRYRTYENTDLTVSEVGFGLWTISTGWWVNFTEGEAVALMQRDAGHLLSITGNGAAIFVAG